MSNENDRKANSPSERDSSAEGPSRQTADESLEQRRATVKKILAAGGVAGGSAIPAKWGKPVVESIFLPAHAQTTQPTAAPNFAAFFDVAFSFNGSRNGEVQVEGTVTPNGNVSVDQEGFRISDALITPAHAFNPANALANGEVKLLVSLIVNREFHYKTWDHGAAINTTGNHGPFDERFGSEVVRIDTKMVTPQPNGNWAAQFSNVTSFNQPTQSFPPEVNNFTNFASFNGQPTSDKRTYIEFPAFPLEVNVAFAGTPDMVVAMGDTLNPYVSPLSFGFIV